MPLILPAAALSVFLAGAPAVLAQAASSSEQTSPKADPKPKAGKADKPKKAKKKKKDETYPQFRIDDHPAIYFGKKTHVDFKARVQEDVKDSEAPTGNAGEEETIDLAKREIGVQGEIAGAVEFEVERAFGSAEPWRDVYADFKYYEAARVRGGKFKLPFSLDETTGARNRDFIYRALAATHLAPGRDKGVMVHGRLFDRLVGYEAGVFEHDGRNARTHNADKVYGGQTPAVRVTVQPLRNTKQTRGDFSAGVAMTWSDVPEGIGGLRGQTVLEQNFFSASDVIVNGRRRRIGVESQLRYGAASVKGEWMRVDTERRGESVEDSNLSPLIGEGWYVSGSYALTRDRKADGLDKPKKPLFQGGVGAIELAARLESLAFRSGASGEPPSRSPRADVILGNRDRVTTLGVNWYVNRWIKIQANFIRETLDDPSQGPLPSQASFTSRVVRFMFSL
jgi:phosphate-selective porin OprO/OprP